MRLDKGKKREKCKNVADDPILLSDWDFDKNKGLDPYHVSLGSGVIVWWKCHACNREWNGRASRRKEVPMCSNCKKIEKNRTNSIAIKNPHLIEEWNYDKNIDVDPSNVYYKSKQKLWWKCKKGHEWEASPQKRNYGHGCHYCSIYKISKEDSLCSRYPNLMLEWDYDKNLISPYAVSCQSGRKMFWKCKNGHNWSSVVSMRVNGIGCPFCSGRNATPEHNIVVENEKMFKEWNYDKNIGIDPYSLSPRSGKKVWWICEKGHEWKNSLHSRNQKDSDRGCPYCTNQKVCIDNCLLTVNPVLASEWNYEKNIGKTPDQFVATSNKRAWWKCKKGHEWEAVISCRANGNNCPSCNKIELIDGTCLDSMVEAWYYLMFKNNGINFKINKRYPTWKRKFRYDFYIPEINTYIEVTSYSSKDSRGSFSYISYLRKIVKKKRFVQSLGANFQFIQKVLTKEERMFVNKNIAR